MTAAVLAAEPTTPTDDRAAAAPRLRVVVRPAPRREPPFDDELDTAQLLGRPSRFDPRLPFEKPAPPTPIRHRPHRSLGLAEPTVWARRLLQGLIETADGHRPLHQLAAMLSPSVARGLGADFERAAAAGTPHWLHRAAVHTVRGDQPAAGVAELCATLEVGERVRAVALRLEVHQGRWRCTRLQLG